jgi:hypothetical protein
MTAAGVIVSAAPVVWIQPTGTYRIAAYPDGRMTLQRQVLSGAGEVACLEWRDEPIVQLDAFGRETGRVSDVQISRMD